jgi:DNA mismatch repair protein MutS2
MVKNRIPSEDPEFPDYFEVREVLDLHGFFPEQVPEILNAFLENAAEKGYCTVRIIHGKGKSRMKWEVLRILNDHPLVNRFYDAPPDLGHWGATIAEIKRS